MESKKDIGKFFRENLDQLDRSPSARVWEGIEADLKEKKKKRRAFFWFFLAAFVCGSVSTLMISNFNNSASGSDKGTKNTIQSETTIGLKNSGSNSPDNPTNSNPGNGSIANPANNINDNLNPGSTIAGTENGSAAKNNASKKPGTAIGNASKTNGSRNNPTAVSASSSKNNAIGFSGKTTRKPSGKNTIASRGTIASGNQKSKSQKGTALASKSKNTGRTNNNQAAEATDNLVGKTYLGTTSESGKNNGSPISEKNNATTKTDSLPKPETAITENEKSLTEKEKDSTVEQPKQESYDVIIAPYYGYSYSGKVGGGNALSSQYDVLGEGGKTNQNYGILVRWMGTERIGIQTGVGVVQASRFTEVEKNGSFFSPNNNLELDAPMETYSGQLQSDSKVKFYEEYQYIEVPLEAYYIWSDNKFGFASSFGISLFFLSKNDVYLESESMDKFRIGSSKNSTPQSFVANAKMNLFYKLSKRIQLDLYPEFQFQFMSHKDVSGFYPYYLSLKAGISYKL